MPPSSHEKPSEQPSSEAHAPPNAAPLTQMSAKPESQPAVRAERDASTEIEIDVSLDFSAAESLAARASPPPAPPDAQALLDDASWPAPRSSQERQTSVPLSPPTLLSQPPPPPLDDHWKQPRSKSQSVTVPDAYSAPMPPEASGPSSVIELESLDDLLIADPPSPLGDAPSRPGDSSHQRAHRPTILPPSRTERGAPSGLIDLKQLLGHLPPRKAPPQQPRSSHVTMDMLAPRGTLGVPLPLWAAPVHAPEMQRRSDGPWQHIAAQEAARATPPQHPERSTVRPIATSLLPSAPQVPPRMRFGAVGLVVAIAALFAFQIIRGNTAPAARGGDVQASVLSAPAPKVTVLDEIVIEVDTPADRLGTQPGRREGIANIVLGGDGPSVSTTRKFDEPAAQASLASGARQAQSCRKQGERAGVVKVTITFAPSGRASQVKLTGDYVGTATGTCISDAFRRLWVQPFDGAPAMITRRVLVR